jgi:hypothetical protein
MENITVYNDIIYDGTNYDPKNNVWYEKIEIDGKIGYS